MKSNNLKCYILLLGLIILLLLEYHSFTYKKANLIGYLNQLETNGQTLIGQAAFYSTVNPNQSYFMQLDQIKSQTGKEVSIFNVDYYHWDNKSALNNINQSNQDIELWDKKGGIAMISLHFNNPITNGNPNDKSLVIPNRIVIFGTPENIAFNKELDDISFGLKELRDKGIIVMIRPFHEMNGNWFWWGAMNTQDFQNLWAYTHNYLTVKKGLNNLLFVFCPNAGSVGKQLEYYPSLYSNTVDIVSLDYYSPNPAENLMGYKELISLGKPFGFSEYSCLPANNVITGTSCDSTIWLNATKNYYNKSSFMISYSFTWSLQYNSNLNVAMNDPRIITLDEVKNTK
jgi:mannan endo-1,4-beta-mannosidase